jgi:hypothetical protein
VSRYIHTRRMPVAAQSQTTVSVMAGEVIRRAASARGRRFLQARSSAGPAPWGCGIYRERRRSRSGKSSSESMTLKLQGSCEIPTMGISLLSEEILNGFQRKKLSGQVFLPSRASGMIDHALDAGSDGGHRVAKRRAGLRTGTRRLPGQQLFTAKRGVRRLSAPNSPCLRWARE